MDFTPRCPNLRVIQTGHVGFHTSLSESKGYSDRTRWIYPFVVRIPGYSDRIRWISPFLVQIQGLFRQDTLDFTLRCPNPGVIQTGHAGFLPSLSESKAYSDRIRWISHFVVRIQGLFRQDTLDFSLRCPNPGVIQTGYVGFHTLLSESKAYSDRTRWISPFVVRIQGLFRQDTLDFTLCCPNPRLIQTGYVGFLPSLSESRCYSDRTRWNSPFVVRIQGLFRQDTLDFTPRCPNLRVIQTGHVGIHPSLSESKGYSDRIRWISHFVVRIQGLFRQNTLDSTLRCPNPRLIQQDTLDFTLPCPNPGVIQTGNAGILPSLSESKAYSDRIRWISHLVVRI